MKTMHWKIDYEALFTTNRREQDLADLIEGACRSRGSLTLKLHEDSVELGCLEGGAARSVVVSGRWVHDLPVADIRGDAARLVLPLLFRVRSMVLPHHCIFNTGRTGRSWADFFVRNLYLTALFAGEVRYLCDDQALPGALAARSSDFGRRYLWLLRGALAEPQLSRHNVRELLAASTYLPLLRFESGLFESAMADIRAGVQSASAVKTDPADLKEAFLALRGSLMPLYGN